MIPKEIDLSRVDTFVMGSRDMSGARRAVGSIAEDVNSWSSRCLGETAYFFRERNFACLLVSSKDRMRGD